MKKIIILMFMFLLLASLVSATELKLTKVSDLKVGDVIVSKAGVEIPVENLVSIKSDQLTISEYIRQKVFGENAQEVKIPTEKVIASGNSGPGVMSGNAIVSLPTQEKEGVSWVSGLRTKIRGWFGLQ